MEIWQEIPEFPGYSVNSMGVIRNDNRDRLVARLFNQQGIAFVSLFQGGSQHSRAISHIVASAFLDPPQHRSFNSVIHLDGDRSNYDASNLMWRPKWFALKYHAQFKHRHDLPDIYPVIETETEEFFKDVWFAAMTFGLIRNDIYTAAWNHTYHSSPDARVWPTGQTFRIP